MASQPPRREDFYIAIICALPLEYDAVTFAFDEFWGEDQQLRNTPGDYNKYKTGRIGSHNVVLLLLSNMGKANAASATAGLRSTYTGIKLAVLTGICGGVPGPQTANELLLGDVVISKSIVEHDLGRRYPDKFARKDTVDDSLGRPNKEIRSLISLFETRQGRSDLQHRASQILTQIQQKAAEDGDPALYQRPSSTKDLLFEPDYLHRHRDHHKCGCSDSAACETARNASCEVLQCDKERLVLRKRLGAEMIQQEGRHSTTANDVQIFIGRVGSGDTVMKSGLDRDKVAAEHGFIAFEMEGAGVWDEIPCIVVKGVCDYADSHKNKNWQRFAAATAASTAKALLEHYTRSDKSTAARTWCVVPYNQNADFVGRSNVLDQIKQLFRHEADHQPADNTHSRVAIHGLGGIGKTQIALAYVYWLQEACPDMSIFWVHASNAQRFRQAYLTIAQECDINGYDTPEADVLMLVKTWLERSDQGRWLMVIDNADDTRLFFPQQSEKGNNIRQGTESQTGLGYFIPECRHGSILITTRNKQTGSRLTRGQRLINVKEMNESEIQKLLYRILEEEASAEEITVLSTLLEHLPLAIAQAAAYMQENSISIGRYLQDLEKSDQSLVVQLSEPFEAVGRDSEIPHAVTATWIVSFNQIQQQDTLASEILSFTSLLDRQGIPEQFMMQFVNEKNKTNNTGLQISVSDVTKALGVLKAFSFISQTKNNTVNMHRLVQLVTRKWLANHDRLADFAEYALKAVSNTYPYGEHDSRELCRDYLPHAYAVLKNNGTGSCDEGIAKACLLHSMTGYFIYMAQLENAEESASQAIELRKQLLGEDDHMTLASMANLTVILLRQGRYKEAEALSRQVTKMSPRVPGENRVHLMLLSMSNTVAALHNQGRWNEAEIQWRIVTNAKKIALGEKHPDTLMSLNNFTSTLIGQGRWREAEELQIQVTETSSEVLGDDNPIRLFGRSNLALIYRNQGRWKEAEEIQLQVMQMKKRVFGDEHLSVLSSKAQLASTYWVQGRWKEAEKLQVEVVEKLKRVLGEKHPDTLTSMTTLAATYKSQGQWEGAEKLQRRVLETCKSIFGEKHQPTFASMGNLAVTLRHRGSWQEAKDLGVQAMEGLESVLGAEHPDTLNSMASLVEILVDQESWKEAEKLGVQATEKMKAVGQNRLDEAEKLEVRVMETSLMVLGEKHPDTLRSMHNLAATWKIQGQQEKAVQLMRKCVNIGQYYHGLDHPSVSLSVSALAHWEKDIGQTSATFKS